MKALESTSKVHEFRSHFKTLLVSFFKKRFKKCSKYLDKKKDDGLSHGNMEKSIRATVKEFSYETHLNRKRKLPQKEGRRKRAVVPRIQKVSHELGQRAARLA